MIEEHKKVNTSKILKIGEREQEFAETHVSVSTLKTDLFNI